MADNTTNTTERVIKTIIVLRNDTEANFQANAGLMLRKGEMAISISDDITKPSKIKVGDGVHTWGELPYINNGDNSGSGTPGEGGVNFTPDGKILQLTTDKVLTLIGADTATAGQSFKISEDGTSIVWFETADKESVTANKTAIDLINESLTKDYYNKTETDALFSKVFIFKGTVQTKEELDAIENPQIGWVYIVKGPTDKEGQLYVYAENPDGNSGYWEDFPLAIEVDLSGYVLTTDFDKFKEAVETRLTDIEGKVTEVETKITEHTTLIGELQNNYASLKTEVDNIKENGSGTPGEDLTELKQTVTDLNDYVESVKPTVDSLPDTIFSSLEIQTLQNGDMRILGTHINKDTDGSYNIGGEAILGTLKAVTANGNPGLMTGEDKAKLDKLFEVVDNGGEPNVIEDIKVGGESLAVNSIDKSVNIPVGGEKLGVVKNYSGDEENKPVNSVTISEDGTMSVPEVHVESLVADDDFVLDGGTAGA